MRRLNRAQAETAVYGIGLSLLAAQGAAGAFQHTHDTAVAHGQASPEWLPWTMAGTPDLLAIVSGIAIQRRRRVGAPVVVPLVILVGSVLVLMGAQLAQAAPGWAGAFWAMWPALAFLAALAIVETEPSVRRAAAKVTKKSKPDTATDAAPARTVTQAPREPVPSPAPAALASPRTAKEAAVEAMVAVLLDDPDAKLPTPTELAVRYNVSKRTTERWPAYARKEAARRRAAA